MALERREIINLALNLAFAAGLTAKAMTCSADYIEKNVKEESKPLLDNPSEDIFIGYEGRDYLDDIELGRDCREIRAEVKRIVAGIPDLYECKAWGDIDYSSGWVSNFAKPQDFEAVQDFTTINFNDLNFSGDCEGEMVKAISNLSQVTNYIRCDDGRDTDICDDDDRKPHYPDMGGTIFAFETGLVSAFYIKQYEAQVHP